MNGDEEIKKLLKEDVEISKEALKILRGIRRANRIAAVFKFLYWLIIIAAAFGAYYYIQPYINKIPSLLNQIHNVQKILQNIPMLR